MTTKTIIPADKPLLVWHYLRQNWETDSGSIKTKVGETYHVESPIEICSHGLHGSRKVLDALSYSAGPILTLCEVWGEFDEQSDKIVAEFRRPLWGKDISPELNEWACCNAEVALLIAAVKDPRSWSAIEAKRAWMRGEISDEELAAARDAAWAAAWAAAWDAAWAAARDAAWDAARDVAWDAARDSAWDAAWDAARDSAWAAARDSAWAAARYSARDSAWAAARDAAWDAARDSAWAAARYLAWDAARDVAWDAAWDAARDAQQIDLESRMVEVLPTDLQSRYRDSRKQ